MGGWFFYVNSGLLLSQGKIEKAFEASRPQPSKQPIRCLQLIEGKSQSPKVQWLDFIMNIWASYRHPSQISDQPFWFGNLAGGRTYPRAIFHCGLGAHAVATTIAQARVPGCHAGDCAWKGRPAPPSPSSTVTWYVSPSSLVPIVQELSDISAGHYQETVFKSEDRKTTKLFFFGGWRRRFLWFGGWGYNETGLVFALAIIGYNLSLYISVFISSCICCHCIFVSWWLFWLPWMLWLSLCWPCLWGKVGTLSFLGCTLTARSRILGTLASQSP